MYWLNDAEGIGSLAWRYCTQTQDMEHELRFLDCRKWQARKLINLRDYTNPLARVVRAHGWASYR